MIQIHTFHIPNFFRRDEREDNGVYAPLQSGDNPSTPPEALVLGSAQHIAETVDPLAQLSAVQRILTKSIFVILGAAVLLPFNALITPSEYFRTRFEGTRWATSFSSWIIVVFNVSTIIFSAHATATIERVSRSSAGLQSRRQERRGLLAARVGLQISGRRGSLSECRSAPGTQLHEDVHGAFLAG